jgi:hypothetical protein
MRNEPPIPIIQYLIYQCPSRILSQLRVCIITMRNDGLYVPGVITGVPRNVSEIGTMLIEELK